MPGPTYIGNTSQLYTLPADTLVVQPSKLAVLTRSYACANSYVDSARGQLAVGSSPSGFGNLYLFRKPSESNNGAITTFQCQYYGTLAASDFYQIYQTTSTEVRSFTASHSYTVKGLSGQQTLSVTGKYMAPVITQTFVRPTDSALRYTIPAMQASVTALEVYANGYSAAQLASLGIRLGTFIPLVASTTSVNETNYGSVIETQLKFTGIAPASLAL